MRNQTKMLTHVLATALMLLGCASEPGGVNVGTGGSGTGGSSAVSSGGLVSAGGLMNTGGLVSNGGAVNTGGAMSTGGAMNTGGAVSSGGLMNTGGAVSTGGAVNTGGAVSSGGISSGGTSGVSGGMSGGGGSGANSGAAGSGGGASGGRGGAGAAGGGGLTGAGGSISGTGGTRVMVEIATSVPSQYRNAVTNPGTWTKKTYPVYYYTTQSGGSASQMGSIPRQSEPITKPCNVYTPPNYDPQTEYPVIFVLHGITDNENTWMERGEPKPNILLDNLITAKVIQPVIAVFPQGNSKPNFATDKSYSDTAGYYLFGNELMNDLVPFIEANYSIKKDRGSRAISGFSMGGMQTINIGLCQNLKNFSWFGAFSPAGGPFSSTQIAQYLQMQDAATYPVNYFYAVVGQSDTTALSSAQAATNELASKTSHITSANFRYHTVSGGHVYPIATIGLYNLLRIAFSN